jgi:predicted acyltransferase
MKAMHSAYALPGLIANSTLLAADGAFLPDGRFVTLPAVPGNLQSLCGRSPGMSQVPKCKKRADARHRA